MAVKSEAYKRGLATYRRHRGKDYVAEILPQDTPVIVDLLDLVVETSYGKIWNRPGLDFRTRGFICMAITATLGAEHEFKQHVRAALYNGITKEEQVEMLIQFAGYLGIPRQSVARRLVREVWKEFDEKAAGRKATTKKSTAKKSTARKSVARKSAVKKSTPRKPAGRK